MDADTQNDARIVGTRRKVTATFSRGGKTFEKGRIVLVTHYQPSRNPKPLALVVNTQGPMGKTNYYNLVPEDGGTNMRHVSEAVIAMYTDECPLEK